MIEERKVERERERERERRATSLCQHNANQCDVHLCGYAHIITDKSTFMIYRHPLFLLQHTHTHTNAQSCIVTKVVYKESSLFYDMGCEKKTGSTRKERDRERETAEGEI